MSRRYWVSVVAALLALGAIPCSGTAQAAPRPRPYPMTLPQAFGRAIANGTRSISGAPGPRYWQQWARYQLTARLDTEGKRLEGRATINYFNRSPDTLAVLYLHLHQNIHTSGAMRNEPQEITGGVSLESVSVRGRALAPVDSGPRYDVSGTILRIRPHQPVLPGDSVNLALAWSFVVPQSGAGRMGWSRDNLFFIAYWYPQMAVYDDVVGWHTDPYLGAAEFHAGFGDYDVTIDAPQGWTVVATGTLENAAEVLPAAIRDRLARAERSDSVIPIVTAADLAAGRATERSATGLLAWRYRAASVRDVAFSVTRASLWDAARTPVGDRDADGRPDFARVDALYRAEAPRWRQAARYARHSIDFLSRFTGFSYPWPHMSAVEGAGIIGGGMEFPMLTLIGDYNQRGDSALYYVVAHELAHMWVPMIVGTDERRYGWMDEGTTSFNENQARKEFFPGPDHDEPDRQAYLQDARTGNESEMLRWTDYLYPNQGGTASYSKPASVLAALRGLLGDSLFLRAYRTYIHRWSYKHPKPWDFFNSFNDVTGKTLDWFWRSWYYETWTLDQAVGAVTAGPNGTRIVVEDRGQVPMPARLTVTLADGTTRRHEVPVEHWLSGARTGEITIPPGARVVKVEIDAERVFPDADRANNTWSAGGRQ